MEIRQVLSGLAAALVVVAGGLAGCVNTEFGCVGYPEGAQCQAVSQVLAQAPEDTGGYLSAEGRRATAMAHASGERASSESGAAGAIVGETPMQLGKPIVRSPDVMRVWLAPWQDDRGRLHEASLVYLMVEPAAWAYTGPALGRSKRERTGLRVVPRAPIEQLAAKTPGGSAAASRPSPQAAGVARPNGSASGPAPSGIASPATLPAAGMLMVPTPSGQQRVVPIPSVGASSGAYQP